MSELGVPICFFVFFVFLGGFFIPLSLIFSLSAYRVCDPMTEQMRSSVSMKINEGPKVRPRTGLPQIWYRGWRNPSRAHIYPLRSYFLQGKYDPAVSQQPSIHSNFTRVRALVCILAYRSYTGFRYYVLKENFCIFSPFFF